MSSPINIEKKFEKWTFDDLCKWASWHVIQSLYEGNTLKSTMFVILNTAIQWKPPPEIK